MRFVSNNKKRILQMAKTKGEWDSYVMKMVGHKNLYKLNIMWLWKQ